MRRSSCWRRRRSLGCRSVASGGVNGAHRLFELGTHGRQEFEKGVEAWEEARSAGGEEELEIGSRARELGAGRDGEGFGRDPIAHRFRRRRPVRHVTAEGRCEARAGEACGGRGTRACFYSRCGAGGVRQRGERAQRLRRSRRAGCRRRCPIDEGGEDRHVRFVRSVRDLLRQRVEVPGGDATRLKTLRRTAVRRTSRAWAASARASRGIAAFAEHLASFADDPNVKVQVARDGVRPK